MKAKNIILVLSLTVTVASCGKSSSGSSAGISPITTKKHECQIGFSTDDSYKEIALKADQMRSRCNMTEEEIVGQL